MNQNMLLPIVASVSKQPVLAAPISLRPDLMWTLKQYPRPSWSRLSPLIRHFAPCRWSKCAAKQLRCPPAVPKAGEFEPTRVLAVGDSLAEYRAAVELQIPFLAIVNPNVPDRFPIGTPKLPDLGGIVSA